MYKGKNVAYAALKAVELLPVGETNLIIYTDSLELVRAFQNQNLGNKDTQGIVEDIKDAANGLSFFKIMKVVRNSVIRAHNLAVSARKGS